MVDTTTPKAVVKQNELLIGSDENVKHLRYIYATQKYAERAAKTAWQRLQRGVAEFSITLAMGRPELHHRTANNSERFQTANRRRQLALNKSDPQYQR